MALDTRTNSSLYAMSYYERPIRYRSLLNTGQVAHMAEMAKGCAHEYVDFLSYGFPS